MDKHAILTSPTKPTVQPVESANIPDALKELTRWVGWRWTNRSGRWAKVPVNVRTGGNASSTNPATWATFVEALDSECDGVGIVLGDGLAGVDLDDCRRDGELTPLAQSIIDRLATYTEVSPTGTGVKLLCFAELPGKGSKSAAGDVEMYDHGRFFVVTGQHVDGTPATVEDRRAELAAVWREFIGTKASVVPTLGANVDVAALNDMLRHVAKPTENDGSKRLLCVACRAIEHDLSDEAAIATIRAYEVSQPFPVPWSDSDIVARLRDAESKAERGAAARMIDVSVRDLAIITPRVWRALEMANQPPQLFRYADAASRIERGDRDDLLIKKLNAGQMRYHLAEAAKWYKYEAKPPRQVFVAPPKDVVDNVLATPDQPLPILDRITETPTFAPDGSLQLTPGYNPASRTYYGATAELAISDVPDRPTSDDVAAARSLIVDELLGDFPFVGDAERAHAVALLLLPFARDLITGPTPLHLLEKPTPGTGATLLADMLALPAIGRPIPAMVAPRDDEEWRKLITSKLRVGSPYMFADNLKHRLDSAALAGALTATAWEDRILGVSDVARLPVRCIWLATGNNPAVSNEIARRTVRIRLDSRTDQPHLRTGFRHPKLRQWAAENRGRLVWAALTLIRAWIVAGRPAAAVQLGMFEEWAETMGGILDVAGVPGFLANLQDFYDESDAEGAEWREFLGAWWQKFGHASTTVKQLWPVAIEEGSLSLGTGSAQSQKVMLGRMLTERRDRVFDLDDQRLMLRRSAKPRQGTYQWSLALAV